MALPYDRVLNAVYSWVTDRIQDPADLEKFNDQLWVPDIRDTRPIPAQSPWSAESETAAFGSLAAAVNGRATQGNALGPGENTGGR